MAFSDGTVTIKHFARWSALFSDKTERLKDWIGVSYTSWSWELLNSHEIRCIWRIESVERKQNWYFHCWSPTAQHTFQLDDLDGLPKLHENHLLGSHWVPNCAPFSAFLMSPSAAKIKASKPD